MEAAAFREEGQLAAKALLVPVAVSGLKAVVILKRLAVLQIAANQTQIVSR